MTKTKIADEVGVGQEVIEEFGYPDGDLYLVTRSFLLRVKDGPLQPVKPGQVVRLSSDSAAEAFLGFKIEPLEIGELFTVLRPIEIVGADGCWICAVPGDEVRLSRSEALDFLRKGLVKQKEGRVA